MPTTNERKAIWFLAVVALSGSGVRLWRANTNPVPTADAQALARQIGRVDSVRAAGPQRRSRPTPAKAAMPRAPVPPVAPRSATPIDLDRATADQIETLPGIGPALAARIVAARDSLGAFGEIGALCEVRGIGPKIAERLRPLVTFTGPRRPVSVACGDASKKPRKQRSVRSGQPG